MQAAVLLLFCAVLLALPGCGGAPDAAPLPALDKDAVILAFGDSLTYGTGAQRTQSYPAVLAEQSGRRVVNAGVPGETTAEGLERLPGVIEKTRPDLVILCLGGNDFLKRKPLGETRANLSAMIELVKAQNLPLLFLAVPEVKLGIRPAPLYAELASQYDLAFLEEMISEVLSDRSLKSDPIHPNARGYERMADEIADYLRDAGALP